MDKGENTMIENLRKNTGKSLEQWIAIVNKEKLEKHGQIVKFLKEQHEFTHGFANLVALKAAAAAKPVDEEEDLVHKQYEGKEHFRPLYDRLIKEVLNRRYKMYNLVLLQKTADKIKSVLSLQTDHEAEDFLRTVIKDYNHLTAQAV